jgi:macrolide transport system ATP-binding/permease protein
MQNGFVQDLRYALRQLRKSPGFAFTAVLILALGIGASVAIFGFVDAALIKPLPYPDPNRLVEVTEKTDLFPHANLSYPDYLDWKKLNQVFSSIDVYNGTGYLLPTAAGAKPVPGERVSDGFFRTLGITPALGRDFYVGEDLPEAARTVILTYASWQKRFGAQKDVIGQTLLLSGVPFTIVGVLPRDFQFAPAGNAEFWTTLHASDGCGMRRSCHSLNGVGRLKDAVSVEMALANMQAIARQLEMQYPADNRGQGATVAPLSDLVVKDVRPILLVLLGGAGLLLLIACVNVSSLLLVRSASRKREIAVRGALGASRARLIRQFITEGLVLMAAGGLLGLVGADGAIQILTRLISREMMDGMPYLLGLGLNLHVLAFAGTVSVLAAALFSFTPVTGLRLTKLREALSEGGRGYAGTLWRRFAANLVVVELAIAVVLLAGAGLLGKSFYRLLHVDIGFQADHLATIQVALSKTAYEKDEQIVAVERQIMSRFAGLPGVESAGISSVLPVSFNGNTDWIRFVGRPYNGEHNEVNQRDVSSAFLSTLHAKLLRGRYFTDAEDASKPLVVIINQTLAKKYFPGEDPIGKRIGDTGLTPKSIKEIIGVVEDVKDGSLDSETWPAVYYPFNQDTDTYFSLIVRTSQSEQSLLPTLVATLHEIDPGIGTMDEATMTDRINDSPTAYLHRSSAWLVGGFAFLALLLGVVGLYGVIAYSVSQRTREIGVRMALGAQRSSVYQLIMTEAGWLAGVGIIAGLVCSIGAATLIRGLLFGVRTWDVATMVAVSAVLAISALLASYIPARRAAKVDPMVALRYE